ncbi:putative ankyrin repeat protein RF_0381 [Cloeon dipterum]|uniref:putative ankyrin repeat protein RF_0381 n=1 Tax=Cloeon dipterum TaxID=197152 RepID=UPI003220344C
MMQLLGAQVARKEALNCGVRKCKNLVDNGADLKEKTKEHGVSVVHFAAANKKHGVELVKYFASLGCKVDAKDSEGEQPLDYAIREEALEVTQEIGRLSDPSYNLLLLCVKKNNLDVAKKVFNLFPELFNESTCEGFVISIIHLAAYFADRLSVNSPISGKTALHVAAELGNDRFCEWFVEEEGVDVKDKTAKGETAADLVPWFNLPLLKYLKNEALK